MFDNETENEVQQQNPVDYGCIHVTGEGTCLSSITNEQRLNMKYSILLMLLALSLKKYSGNGSAYAAEILKISDVLSNSVNTVYTTPVKPKANTIAEYNENITNAMLENHVYSILLSMVTNRFAQKTDDPEKYGYENSPQIYSFKKKRKDLYDTSKAIETVAAFLPGFYGDSITKSVVGLATAPDFDTPEGQKRIINCICCILSYLTARRDQTVRKIKNPISGSKSNITANHYLLKAYRPNGENTTLKFNSNGSLYSTDNKITNSISIDGREYLLNDMRTQTKFIGKDGQEKSFISEESDIFAPSYFLEKVGYESKRHYVNTRTGVIIETPDVDIECITEDTNIRIYYNGRWYDEGNNAVAYWDGENEKLLCSLVTGSGQIVLCSPNSKENISIFPRRSKMVDPMLLKQTIRRLINKIVKSENKQVDDDDVETLESLNLGYLLQQPFKICLLQNLKSILRFGNLNPLRTPFSIDPRILNKSTESINDEEAKEIIKSAATTFFVGELKDDGSPEAAATRKQVAQQIVKFYKELYPGELDNDCYVVKSSCAGEDVVGKITFNEVLNEFKRDKSCREFDKPSEAANEMVNLFKEEILNTNNNTADIAHGDFAKKHNIINADETNRLAAEAEEERRLQDPQGKTTKKVFYTEKDQEKRQTNEMINKINKVISELNNFQGMGIIKRFLHRIFGLFSGPVERFTVLVGKARDCLRDLTNDDVKQPRMQQTLELLDVAVRDAAKRVGIEYEVRNINNQLPENNLSSANAQQGVTPGPG